jgi:hypothetical protein
MKTKPQVSRTVSPVSPRSASTVHLACADDQHVEMFDGHAPS